MNWEILPIAGAGIWALYFVGRRMLRTWAPVSTKKACGGNCSCS